MGGGCERHESFHRNHPEPANSRHAYPRSSQHRSALPDARRARRWRSGAGVLSVRFLTILKARSHGRTRN